MLYENRAFAQYFPFSKELNNARFDDIDERIKDDVTMTGLVINTNMNALEIENTLGATNAAVSSSLRKLSAGLRINSSQNDPAGYAIANSFIASIAATKVALQNANQAQSLLQTADDGYSQINDIMVKMKAVATEAASGQQSQSNLTSLNSEFGDLSGEIDNIANSTRYKGLKLINGDCSGIYAPLIAAVDRLDVNNGADSASAYYAIDNINQSQFNTTIQATLSNMLNIAVVGEQVSQFNDEDYQLQHDGMLVGANLSIENQSNAQIASTTLGNFIHGPGFTSLSVKDKNLLGTYRRRPIILLI